MPKEIIFSIFFGCCVFFYQHFKDSSNPKFILYGYAGVSSVLAVVLISIALVTGHKISHVFFTVPEGLHRPDRLVMAFWGFFAATACQLIVLYRRSGKS